MLKQLTELGHAIGTIASLDMEQLRQVAAIHVGTAAAASQAPALAPAPPREAVRWRVAVVGTALGQRLQQPSLLRRLQHLPQVSGPFSTLAGAVEAEAGEGIDLLLVQAAGLHERSLPQLQAAAATLGARRVAVFYGFAAESACDAFTSAGIALLREPQADATLANWLLGLRGDPPAQPAAPPAPASWPAFAATLAAGPVPPRRYDDATLANFAGLSSTVSCECPRHVVELVLQLSHFEAYSAECELLSPADAALHAGLRETSAAARHLFELALERLAMHEGLLLPTT